MYEERLTVGAGWEPLLGSLFEQSPGFMALLKGPEHTFELANRSYRRLVGNRTVLERTVREVFPELTGSGFFELLDRAFASGQPYIGRDVPLRLDSGPGQPDVQHYIDFIYQPLVDSSDNVFGIFCQGQDVTDRVLAERRLKEKADELAHERQVFHTALTFSEDFNYVFDTHGRFSYVNKPLLDLWGMDLASALGKTFHELPYPTELAEKLQQQIEAVVRTAKQVRDQTYYVGPGGNGGWFEYIFNPVFDAEGQVVAVAGSTRNITARIENERTLAVLMASEQAARNEAERASRVKDEFLATLSHELRTPLNSIMGWAEMLKSGRVPADKVQHGLERIVHNAKAQAQLIGDLLDVNSIAAGKVRLALERLPLSKPLYAALDAIMPAATAKGIVVVPPTFATELHVVCDPDRLQQVFWNLLTNAIKFTPAAGTISVGVASDQNSASVGIADSGTGIDPAFLPRLFDRFSQADSSSTRRYTGLGLGLSICKSLVELHGGSIEARSDGVGLGATLLVTLPLAQPADDAEPSHWGSSDHGALPPPSDAKGLSGVHVLVVDDEEEGRSFVSHLLREYGAQVSEASSADAAVLAITRSHFQLIVCDISMPGTDGYTLLQDVRRSPSTAHIPAIALTAFARPEDQRAALDAGFDVHLAKPVSPATIVETCFKLLGA
jgi:PAS domain S-box-containing protein